MNDVTIDKQTSLQAFFYLVQKGEIPSEDLLPNALCYSEFQNYFNKHPQERTAFWLTTPENQKKIISDAIIVVQRELRPPNSEGVHQFDPNGVFPQVLSPKESVEAARHAGDKIKEQHDKNFTKHNIPGLVENFVQTLAKENREAAKNAFLEPVHSPDPIAVKEEIVTRFEKSGITKDDPAINSVKNFIDTEGVHTIIANEFYTTQRVADVVANNIDSPRVFVENFIKKIEEVEEVTPITIERAIRYARITTFVKIPNKLDGFTLKAVGVATKITDALNAAEKLSFLDSWGAAREEILKNAVSSEAFKEVYQKLLQSGDAVAASLGPRQAFQNAESLISEIFKAPASQDMLDYLNGLNGAGTTILTNADVHQFFVARFYANNPGVFHFEYNPSHSVDASPLNWVLHFGEKGAATAGSAAKKAAVTQFLTKFFSWLGVDAITALSGPIAWIWWAATNIIPWVGNALAAVVAPIGALIGGAAEGFRGTFNLPKPKQAWYDNPTIIILIILALAIGLPVIMATSRFNGSMGQFIVPGKGSRSSGVITSCANTDRSRVYVQQNDPGNPDVTNYTCYNANPTQPACYSKSTSCTIGDSGCGSAAVTMIEKAFNLDADVKKIWDRQHSTGGYDYGLDCNSTTHTCTYGCASYVSSVVNILTADGLSVSSYGVDGWDEAEKKLNCCGLILALGYAHVEDVVTGHFIVITGIHRTEGQVTSVDTLDPAQPTFTTQTIVGPTATFTFDTPSDSGLWGVSAKGATCKT